MFYAHINSKNILVGIDTSMITTDEYGSVDIQNIEVSEKYYNNLQLYGNDYYTYSDGEIVINPEWDNIQLNKAKEQRISENDGLRDTALLRGVTYNNVLFDSDNEQKINLLAKYSMMADTDTVVWYGMDNTALLCTKGDLMAIGRLIETLHTFCWENNAYVKEQIAEAKSISELNDIEIDYGG